MNTFSGICFASLLMSVTAHSMEAPKRANECLESTTIKKPRTETLPPLVNAKIITYLCKATCNNRLCYKEFNTQGLLKRHLREAHGFSPRHIERYSMPANNCHPEFK